MTQLTKIADAMIPLSIPHLSGNELKYVTECIQSGWISSAGSYVNRFEESFAQKLGSAHAVACSSGTAALHISLLLAGVRPDDEVIVPTVTFIAPVNTVRYVGAHPVFMDCDDHLNINVEKVGRFLREECRFVENRLVNKMTDRAVTAIIPVHIFGHPVDMEGIMVLADEFNLKVIEDATESLGSCYADGNYKDRKTGTIGHMGCFSFNGNKIISTGGGGMIVSSNKELAQKARYLTTQAKDDLVRFVHNEIGYNYRLNNVQAAIGVAQLERLEKFVAIKRKNFAAYREALNGIAGLRWVEEPTGTLSNYWHYALIAEDESGRPCRDELFRYLQENQIECRPIWQLNHRQKPYEQCESYCIERARYFEERVLNIPCSTSITDQQISSVSDTIRKFYGLH